MRRSATAVGSAGVTVVASWNVNGIGARLDHVVRYLELRAPDLLCLQEIKVRHDDFPRERFRELGYRSEVLSSGGYAGVAILTREPLENVVYDLEDFEPERAAGRRLGGKLGLTWFDTVYVPTRTAIGKIAFLDALTSDHARRFGPAARVLLCGDFNVCFDERDLAKPNMIRQASLHPERPEDLAFRRLVDGGRLVDSFRYGCAEGGHYTWFPPRPQTKQNHQGMRLDYIFLRIGRTKVPLVRRAWSPRGNR